MQKIKVLFICTHHGARSRIAAEFAKRMAPDSVEIKCSCFEEGKIGSLPVSVMKELGIDLSTDAPKSVFDRFKEGETFDYVISLCHEATNELCPIFKTSIDTLYAKKAQRLAWAIQDFKSLEGTAEEKMLAAREIRDNIKSSVTDFFELIDIHTKPI